MLAFSRPCIFIVGCAMAACALPRSSELRLRLDLERRESSKDSHWSNAKLSIDRGIVKYSVTHGGRDPRPDRNETYSLSREDEALLIAFIREKKLDRNLSESKPPASPGTSVKLRLEIDLAGAKTKAEIAGAVNDWRRRRETGSPTNLDNIDYFKRVRSLLIFLKRRLGHKEIET